MAAPAIEIAGLTYGDARGIEDLSLSVGRGEVLGFLGPTGAGKTTTIRLLLDLIRPTRGRAQYGAGVSEREREVLRLLALGHTNHEIAKQLNISVRTAETHRAHIMQKLQLTTRAELVRHALPEGCWTKTGSRLIAPVGS